MSAVLDSSPGAAVSARVLRRAVIAAVLMLVFSALAYVLTPREKLTELRGKPDYEALLPKQFGDWREEPMPFAQIVNPQQEEMLQRIYTQTLNRTYVNSRGRRVMLSLAYGEDQRDGMQLHYPEVCYPAQGFMLLKQERGVIQAGARTVPVKRLQTELGVARKESVTYWTLLGDSVFRGGTDKKIAELRYGFSGKIADGLLFRMSSIEPDPRDGYALHEAFARDLIAAMDERQRHWLIGVR